MAQNVPTCKDFDFMLYVSLQFFFLLKRKTKHQLSSSTLRQTSYIPFYITAQAQKCLILGFQSIQVCWGKNSLLFVFKARGAFVHNGPSHLTSEITHVLYIPASSQFWAIKQTLRDKTFEKLDFSGCFFLIVLLSLVLSDCSRFYFHSNSIQRKWK